MISIVTGTLNRKHLLPGLIQNTILSNENLELVLVDGGSTDGTLEYLRSVNHQRLKVVEVGGRSSYPHFMNLGIKAASNDLICQWNDDVLLINDWSEVIHEVDDQNFDACIFSWQYLPLEEMGNKKLHETMTWNLCNEKDKNPEGDIVVNYGIYRKKCFQRYGLFDHNFHFYYADAELAHRFYCFGAKFKNCYDIRVASIAGVSKICPQPHPEQVRYYELCKKNQLMREFQSHLEILA